jgi:CheY-like chemotaxis protein
LARTTPPAKQKTILLVDDEALWLNSVRTAMLGEGIRILTAAGGEEALQRLSEARPDLILSDIRMPVMNGFDLFEKVRSDPGLRSIPYVFMSSIDDFDARNTAKTLGADGYIEKPFDVEGVRVILADLLGRLHDQ